MFIFFLYYFRCEIILASWALDTRLLDLIFDGEKNFDISAFIQSNEWILVETSAWKNNVRYHSQCNHSQVGDFVDYAQLIHSITVRRRLGFYVYALIIPSVVLSLFRPLTFWIPTTGDGRITIGICLLELVCLADVFYVLTIYFPPVLDLRL